MYIDIVPNRKSRPAILLRESIRDGKRIVKRTIANLSSLSLEQAEGIRAVLKGKTLAPVDELFEEKGDRFIFGASVAILHRGAER